MSGKKDEKPKNWISYDEYAGLEREVERADEYFDFAVEHFEKMAKESGLPAGDQAMVEKGIADLKAMKSHGHWRLDRLHERILQQIRDMLGL